MLQASSTEPAVFHAAIALSLLHKSVAGGHSAESNRLDYLATQAYNKAIGYLVRPDFDSRERSSGRVALIACMLFTCLEFLRGRYRTGQQHLSAGLRILGELYGSRNPATETADGWLLEVFGRIKMLAMHLGQEYIGGLGSRHIAETTPSSFNSVSQARNMLDGIALTVSRLRGMSCYSHQFEVSENHAEEQQLLESRLAAWNNAYKTSTHSFYGNKLAHLGQQLLYLHYIAAAILVKTCLCPGDEMAYDLYVDDFRSLISHAVDFAATVRELHSSDDPTFSSDKSHFTADMGWIPPLYFTAIHCRDHDTRWQAVDLLRLIPSKEGIWDSSLAVAVAEHVIRLEEGHPSIVPAEQRVTDVKITLPNNSQEDITITCQRPTTSGNYETVSLKIQRHDTTLSNSPSVHSQTLPANSSSPNNPVLSTSTPAGS